MSPPVEGEVYWLRIHLLSSFRVERGGQEVANFEWLHRAAAKTLVKLLAMEPSHRMHREEIIEILWPDADPDSALNRFAKALHAARHALEPGLEAGQQSRYLTLSADLVILNTDHTWVDLEEFERLAAAALGSGQSSAYEDALSSYTGELLPEDRYEDWSIVRREAAGNLFERLSLAYAELLYERGDLDGAEEQWKNVLERDRAREEIHRALMRLYAGRGARTLAIRQYEACRSALEELGTQPEPETEELYREITGTLADDAAEETTLRLPDLPSLLRRADPPRLIGRTRVVSILGQYLEDALEGQGSVALITGELGIGKTSVMASLAHAAHDKGFVVLWGVGGVHQHVVPYGPFVEAIQRYLDVSAADVRTDIARRYSSLSLLIPGLSGEVLDLPFKLDPHMLHGQLVAQFAALLADLSARWPVFLGIDDLHALDAPSLYLLKQLAASADRHRWLIMATYRMEDVEAGSELSHFLASFAGQSLGRRIILGRLSRDDSGELVRHILSRHPVSREIVERIHALSLGNPLFVFELTHALQEEQQIRVVDDEWRLVDSGSQLPTSVSEVVAARMRGLSAPARRLLDLAAVIGVEFSVRTLILAADSTVQSTDGGARVLDNLDEALAAEMLEDRGDTYAFSHPLVQAALLRQLPTHRREHLHEAVAEAIERDQPSDVEALAFHYSRSSNREKAIAFLDQAARRAELLFAYAESTRYLRELITMLDTAQRPGEAARMRQRLAFVLTRMGRYTEALVELERAAAAHKDAADYTNLAFATAQIANTHFMASTPREGSDRVRQLMDEMTGSIPSTARAALYTSLASIYWIEGRYNDQLELTTRALELLRDAQLAGPDDEERIHVDRARNIAELWHGIALAALERTHESLRELQSTLPHLEGTHDLLSAARACDALSAVCRDIGDMERHDAYLQRGLEVARRLNDTTCIAFMLCREGRSLTARGRWVEARESFMQARRIADEIGPSWVTAYPVLGLASLALLSGKWSELEDLLVVARAAAARTQDAKQLRRIQSLIGEYELARRQAGRAYEAWEPLLRSRGIGEADTALVLSGMARASLAQENVEDAVRLADRAHDHVLRRENLPARMEVLRTWGVVAGASRRWESGRQALEESAELARQLRDAYAEARAIESLGRSLADEGITAAATTRLQSALKTYRRLGAFPRIEAVETALARMEQHAESA